MTLLYSATVSQALRQTLRRRDARCENGPVRVRARRITGSAGRCVGGRGPGLCALVLLLSGLLDCPFRGGFIGQSAMAPAVAEVDHESYRHPDEEPQPCAGGQETHEEEAREGGEDRHHGVAGYLERPREVWPRPPENHDPDGDQHEGGEGPNVHKLPERHQREKEREQRRGDAGYDGDPVRRAEGAMDLREPARQQLVPAHCEGDPALAEHQDHHHHREPYEDCERDDQPRRREGCRLQRRGRRGRGGQRIVGHESRKDDGGQDVENRADRQGAQDADGQVSLRIARLLGGGGHDVETYVGEEDQRRRREDARHAVYGVYPQKARQEVDLELLPSRLRRRDEGREVRGRYVEYSEAYDEQRNEDLDRRDYRVELRAQFYPYDQDGRHERYHYERYEIVGGAAPGAA